ncbi:hypothetical protein P154DRAFT_578042 [Amniculicola lignicola CBS 123094]|uniref:NB-ARC domain-containing protein n=1 Tax=Amniculicola lignicola CBS 123094 TaxID=1392246 RepID=A0A6A5WGA9_9PLEO|nr:hypothetical protein P154DRAFT_578042 [Amniculicola lignicola CBS 123094]
MPGLEALAVVSIVANLLQLVDYSSRAFVQIKECNDDSSHLPRAFLTLQNQMPLISHSLKITWKHAESNELDEDSCWKKNFKALLSCFHDKEVAAIEATLSRSLTVINRYHGAYTSATTGGILKKLIAAVESFPEVPPNYSEQVSSRHFLVPSIWSDDFSGRKETMDRLEQMVAIGERHSRAAIAGHGGVGKTRAMFDSRARTNKACLEIAKLTKIPGWDDPKTDKLELISAWLDSPQSGSWILMVDNADDYDLLFGSGKLVKSFPKSSSGTILMTTRDARVGIEFAKRSVIMLGTLTLKEPIFLVDSRLGPGENEMKDITKLGEELCGIPLALIQACSFITQNFLSIVSYLELYHASERDKIKLLSEDFEDEVRDSKTLNSVAAT